MRPLAVEPLNEIAHVILMVKLLIHSRLSPDHMMKCYGLDGELNSV